jgi:uncharacterized protein YdhG (YjbR/CyaY superfamily)
MMSKVKSVDQYLKAQPLDVRRDLDKILQIIKKTVPDAQEVMSYGMLGFKYHGMLAWCAGSKNHCSVYVQPKFLNYFGKELALYRTSQSTLKFPLNKPQPSTLLRRIVKHVANENMKKSKKNKRLASSASISSQIL